MPKSYDPYEELGEDEMPDSVKAKWLEYQEEQRIEREFKYSPRVQRKIQNERRTGLPKKESKTYLFFGELLGTLIAVGLLMIFFFL